MSSESTNTLNSLVVSLEAELGFERYPSGKWVIHDEFKAVGDYGGYEVLPARSRVSIDGTRYEVGVKREDLEGLLALTKIVNKDAQGLRHVLSFWGESKVFSSTEEDGWVYIGRNIEPTTEGFEVADNAAGLAFNTAIDAAILNKTYGQMNEEKGVNYITHAENPTGRSMLFGPSIFDTLEGKSAPEDSKPHYSKHSHKQRTPITATNLSEYPLTSGETWLNFAPGTLIRDGESKARTDMSIVGHNGLPEVFIASLESRYNDDTNCWDHDDVRLTLPIPEGIEIKTVADVTKLKYARLTENRSEEREVDVSIRVEPNALYLTSFDNRFSLIMRKPICNSCKTPVWKFPFSQNESVAGSSVGGLYSTNTSLGILRYLVDTDEGQKTYCANCIGDVVDKYVRAHPNADFTTAKASIRKELDKLGYNMVDIPDHGIYPFGREHTTLTAIINYERDGRKITRIVGHPTITHDGEFTPNMRPMEFVNFQYQP